jgi:hypothetical protein
MRFSLSRLFRLSPALCLSGLAACMSAGSVEGPSAAAPGGPGGPDVSAYGRALGTLTALYPDPRPDGGYDLELRFTGDTVLVDYAALSAYASDSVGRSLLRSSREPFYTRDGHCLFSPKKDACLAFRESAP